MTLPHWAALATITLGAVLVLSTFRWTRNSLLRRAASPAAFWLAGAAYVAWCAIALATVTLGLPQVLMVAALIAPFAVLFMPEWVVRLTGGVRNKWRLLHAYYRVGPKTDHPASLIETERRAVRTEVMGLNRFRSPETAMWLDAAIEELLDRLEDRSRTAEYLRQRERRILELGDQLWGPSVSGSNRDARPVHRQ